MKTVGLRRVHVVRLEEGNELMSELEGVANSLDIRGALVNGMGEWTELKWRCSTLRWENT